MNFRNDLNYQKHKQSNCQISITWCEVTNTFRHLRCFFIFNSETDGALIKIEIILNNTLKLFATLKYLQTLLVQYVSTYKCKKPNSHLKQSKF